MIRWPLSERAPAATLLVRLLVGGVFLSEGIQKFLYPDALGVDRFTKIGIPAPAVLAPFVGVVELVCGLLLIVGLLTPTAAIPLIIDMTVARGGAERTEPERALDRFGSEAPEGLSDDRNGDRRQRLRLARVPARGPREPIALAYRAGRRSSIFRGS
jgi:uncharacterized membrane protein YphA (DoxX/SURF4 family)